MLNKYEHKKRRHTRIRAKVRGTSQRPRLAVFRSNQHLTVQAIDDTQGKVLFALSDKDVKGKKKGQKMAKELGAMAASKLKEKGVELAVFDRGGYKYHGNVKALAEGAREGGLQF